MARHYDRGSNKPKRPKNHFVPIPRDEERRPRRPLPKPPTHDRLDHNLFTGSLGLTIEALTAIHIGAGWFDEHGDRLVKATLRSADRPIVPGSSIKGACRQWHEALTSSADPWFPQSTQGLDGARKNGLSALLFGHLGWRGRITFDDAVPTAPVELAIEEVREPHSPLGDWFPGKSDRNGRKVEEPPRKAQGRRFYGRLTQGRRACGNASIQVIPAGTRLATALRFHNVDPAELGSVLVALGLGEPRFPWKLGGFKNETLGWVRVHVDELTRRRGLGRSSVEAGAAFAARAVTAADERFGEDPAWQRVLGLCVRHLDPLDDVRRPG